MKTLIDKAEELKEASIHAQNSVAGLRQALHKKQKHLKFLQKQLSDHSLVETHAFLHDEEAQVTREIEELASSIEGIELEYDELFSRLRESTNEIASLEEEIVSLRGSFSESTPGWKQEGSRYSKEYLLDSDTKQVLLQRLTDLQEHIPDLNRRKDTLMQQKTELGGTTKTLENTVTHADNHIANLQENIASSEQYLNQHATYSPVRGSSNLSKMWNSLKSLWSLMNDSLWDGECEDIPKAVIAWCAHMKRVLAQRKLEHNRLSESSAQQQVTISQLQESLKNSVPKKEFNIQRMKLEAISQEESNVRKELGELKILLGKASETQIAHDTESDIQFKEEEQKLQNQLAKLRGYCEHKASQLQSLNEDFDYKNSAVESLTGRLEDLVALEREIETKLDRESKENTRSPMKRSIKVPLASTKAFYYNSLVKVAVCLDIDTSAFTESQLIEEVVSSVEQLYENMQKVKRFKKNKEKFVEMYEQKSKELQDEWEQLRCEQNLTRNELQSLKDSKEVLDNELNALKQLKTELSYTNSALGKEKTQLEEQIHSLQESTTTYAHLKERETHEYNRSHLLYIEETDNYESLLKELKQLQCQLKQLHEERIDFEVTRDQLKTQTNKLEEKKKNFEQEIEGYDEMITKLSHKLTTQQQEVYSELDTLKNSIKDKKIELDQLQGVLFAQDAKALQREDALKSLSDQLQTETEKQGNLRKETKQVAQELKQVQQDIESSNKTLEYKTKKLKELDTSIHSKTSQLGNTRTSHKNSLSELQNVEAKLNQLKSEESSLLSAHNAKQGEISSLSARTTEKKHELRQLDTLFKEKSQKLAYTEKRLKDSKQLISLEEENYVKLKDESSYTLNKISCLKDDLYTIESQKAQFLLEIDEMHKRMSTDESKYKQDVEKLRTAVSNGETTLRQLMEAVQKCRNKVIQDKEEITLLTTEINSLELSRENTHSEIKHLKSELEFHSNKADNYKIEEDSVMVLLAISGQKTPEHIKKRVTEIVKSAIELERVKAKLFEAERELEVHKQHTRMENTVIYSSHRFPEHIESGASSVDFAKLLPETEEIRDLLKNLECTQQRLKSLTPVPQEDL